MPDRLDPSAYDRIVREALAEDVGSGDVTTAAIVPKGALARAVMVVKSDCVLAGLDVAKAVFAALDPAVRFLAVRSDGDACVPGDRVAEISGPAAGILTGERVALNFLQHLSGIATRTRELVRAADGRIEVLDTRKTVPGMRALAKYAVACGGGVNHRKGLFDGVLIKDNHIAAAGGLAEAVRRVRATGTSLAIEVEAETLDDVDAAVAAGADIVLLDNMDDATVRRAVGRVAGRARIEVSGGLTVDRVRRLADSGADYVSVGALTHSVTAADISLEFEKALGTVFA
jgi:nicotinate-nucleotide pyrophosphorylase (carboxylating)